MRVNDGKSTGLHGVLLGVAVIALTGMVGTIGLMREVGELGPKVGDIVAFEPSAATVRNVNARIAAMAADDIPGVACVLDVHTMHAEGGSVVIEAKHTQAPPLYRVHWAGPRSSDDGTSCGPSADLLLSQEDVQILAMAAGGYGVPSQRFTASALWGGGASTK